MNPSKPVSLQALLDGRAAEKQPTQKTIYSWKRVLEQLGTFVGHNDAARLTPEIFLHWKTTLLEAGLRPRPYGIPRSRPSVPSSNGELIIEVRNESHLPNPRQVRGKMVSKSVASLTRKLL